LSPSYDLLNVAILLPDDKDELALTIGGKKKKLKRKHFEQFGIGLGLTNKQMKGTFMRMVKNKSKAIDLIDQSFLSDKMKIAYKEVLEAKYKQIE
jgi:serine/threonine-protein kinase HipA